MRDKLYWIALGGAVMLTGVLSFNNAVHDSGWVGALVLTAFAVSLVGTTFLVIRK